MATRIPTRSKPSHGDIVLYQWVGLAQDDDGAPVELAEFADASIEFSGTFGGATATLQGGNVAAAYTLTDAQASPISKTTPGLEQVAEVCRYIRPLITGGDGTTSIVATLYARRPR